MIVFENENNKPTKEELEEFFKKEFVIEISHEDLFGTPKEQKKAAKDTEVFLKEIPLYKGHEFDRLFHTGKIHTVLAVMNKNRKSFVGWLKSFDDVPLKEEPKDTYLLAYEIFDDKGGKCFNFKEFIGTANGPKYGNAGSIVFYNTSNKNLPEVGFKCLKDTLKGIKETFGKLIFSNEYLEKEVPYYTYYKTLRKKVISSLLSGKLEKILVP